MNNQFQPPIEKKVEDEAAPANPAKKIENISEKAAEKSSKTEKESEKDHTLISR